MHIAQEYTAILREKLGDRLEQVILFGSQARGDAWEGSDYDVVVVVKERSADVEEIEMDAGVEMMNRYEALFGALIYDEEGWRRAQEFPLGWNIKKEGIVL